MASTRFTKEDFEAIAAEKANSGVGSFALETRFDGCLKLSIEGEEFAFPGNNEYDPQDDNWTIENLKSRTFDEFRLKVINFLIQKSIKLTQNERNAINIADSITNNNIEITGNLVSKDIEFLIHGKAVKETDFGKTLTLEEGHTIGTQLKLRILRENNGGRNNIILPAWIKYIESDQGKQLSKKRAKEYSRNHNRYMELTGQKSKMKESVNRWNLTGVDWTFKLVLDNQYKENIDNINKTLTEQGVDQVNKVDYIVLESDEKKQEESEITVPCDILVGDLRNKIYEMLWTKNEVNRNNKWLQNIKFSKNDVSLKIKFSKMIKEFDEAEVKKVSGGAKNGDTIKIGVDIPLWYNVVLRLNTVTMNMLNDENEEEKKVKDEIVSIVNFIKQETR